MLVVEILRIVLGSIFVLFLPGFALTWTFFPKKNELDWIERVALSFGLSIAAVPLVVFYLNFGLKVPINLVNTSMVILGLIAIGSAGWWWRARKRKVNR